MCGSCRESQGILSMIRKFADCRVSRKYWISTWRGMISQDSIPPLIIYTRSGVCFLSTGTWLALANSTSMKLLVAIQSTRLMYSWDAVGAADDSLRLPGYMWAEEGASLENSTPRSRLSELPSGRGCSQWGSNVEQARVATLTGSLYPGSWGHLVRPVPVDWLNPGWLTWSPQVVRLRDGSAALLRLREHSSGNHR